jgi:hypothetical protein
LGDGGGAADGDEAGHDDHEKEEEAEEEEEKEENEGEELAGAQVTRAPRAKASELDEGYQLAYGGKRTVHPALIIVLSAFHDRPADVWTAWCRRAAPRTRQVGKAAQSPTAASGHEATECVNPPISAEQGNTTSHSSNTLHLLLSSFSCGGVIALLAVAGSVLIAAQRQAPLSMARRPRSSRRQLERERAQGKKR